MEKIIFGAGCFWCVEAVFLMIEGVSSVVPGYSGGAVKNPTYKEVCSGLTGHAEVVEVTYDPETVNLEELLDIFWQVHDPTSLNRQGADVGTQYRSVIYYHNEKQKEIILAAIEELNKRNIYDQPVVTEVAAYQNFYKAEKEHIDYYNNNKNQPYCQFVISPKIKKVKTKFKDMLK